MYATKFLTATVPFFFLALSVLPGQALADPGRHASGRPGAEHVQRVHYRHEHRAPRPVAHHRHHVRDHRHYGYPQRWDGPYYREAYPRHHQYPGVRGNDLTIIYRGGW